MARQILVRALSLLGILAVLQLLITVGLELLQGDIATSIAGDSATPEQIQAIEDRLGLDRPVLIRYFESLGGVFTGDFGTSWYTGGDVFEIIVGTLPITLSLAVAGMILAFMIAIPLGTLAAARPGGRLDRFVSGFAASAMSVPQMVVGLLLITVLGLGLGVLPTGGFVSPDKSFPLYLQHLILPAVTLAIPLSAQLVRQVRNSVGEALSHDAIRTANAVGLRGSTVLWKDTTRIASTTVLTVVGLLFAHALEGAIIIETVFAMPGLGTAALTGVLRRDIPVVQGIVILTGIIVVVINLIVDLINAYLNPKLR